MPVLRSDSASCLSIPSVFLLVLFACLRSKLRLGVLGDLHHLFTDEVERLEVAVHHANDAVGRDEEGYEDEARHARIEAQPFAGHVARDDPDEHQERSFVTKQVGRNARGRGGARITKKEEDVRVQVGCTHHRVVPGEDAEEPDGNPVGHHVRGLNDRAGAKHGGHHTNGPEELGTVRAAVLRVERGELQVHERATALLGGTEPGEVCVAKLSISGKAELHEGLYRNDCLVGFDSEMVRRFYRLGRRESRLARLMLPDHADMRHAVRLPERGREEIRAAHNGDLDDVAGKVKLEIRLEGLFN